MLISLKILHKKCARRGSIPRRAPIIYPYLFFVLVLDLAGDQADLLHAAVGRAGDGTIKVTPDELIPYLGQTAELFLHQTADGHSINVVILLDAQLLGRVIHAGAAGDQPAAIGLLTHILDNIVMLVPDLANQFLQNILQRDDAGRAARIRRPQRPYDACSHAGYAAARKSGSRWSCTASGRQDPPA